MTPATLRSVWFSITTATEDPPGLPVPIGHNFDELPDRAPIASLSFHTADEALQWAIWVDHEHTSRWSDNGTVTFIGDRMGWRWLLSCHKPSKRSLISSSREVDGSERLLVPCGRCGHGEGRHFGRGPARRGCGACPTGNCEPVLVPVGAAATTTIVDAEDEVE
jgi:hypothetical protein